MNLGFNTVARVRRIRVECRLVVEVHRAETLCTSCTVKRVPGVKRGGPHSDVTEDTLFGR